MKNLLRRAVSFRRLIAQTLAVIFLYVADVISSGTIAGIGLPALLFQAVNMGVMVIAVEIAKDVRTDGKLDTNALSKTLSKTDLGERKK